MFSFNLLFLLLPCFSLHSFGKTVNEHFFGFLLRFLDIMKGSGQESEIFFLLNTRFR